MGEDKDKYSIPQNFRLFKWLPTIAKIYKLVQIKLLEAYIESALYELLRGGAILLRHPLQQCDTANDPVEQVASLPL